MKFRIVFVLLSFISVAGLKAQIINIPDSLFKQCLLEDTLININGDSEIQIIEAENASIINCNKRGITSLVGIEHFRNLDTLCCQENYLEELDISLNQQLRVLKCSDNRLESLDLSQNLMIERLSAFKNNLTYLDISQNIELKSLHVNDNNLSELILSHLENLIQLNCANNQLTELDLSALNQLTAFWAYENNLENLDLSFISNLRLIHVSDNLLENLNVKSHINLYHFNCGNNKISNLELSQNVDLNYLFVANNNLSEIDLSNLLELETLICWNNELRQVDFDNNDLMRVVNVSHNNIVELDVSHLINLETIIASNNLLEFANIANGNNLNFNQMKIEENKDLFCINVDQNLDLNNLPMTWVKDDHAMYNDDCCGQYSIDLMETICEGESYTSPSGNITLVSSGMFLDTIFNTIGCDSLFTITLNVESANVDLIQNQDSLLTSMSSSQYQWIDCETGLPISGENNYYFIPTESGEYAVQIVQDGCYQTSDCMSVILSNVIETKEYNVSVFPNPTHGNVFVETLNKEPLNLVVRNSLGQIVSNKLELGFGNQEIVLSESGVYFFTFYSDSEDEITLPIVKY